MMDLKCIIRCVKGIFITGTDTGVGKTLLTGLLGRYLLERGLNVVTQKWVDAGGLDIKTHFRLMKKKPSFPIDYLCPYTFKFPSSPHLSSKLENKIVKPEIIKDKFLFLKEKYDIVLIEGTGGLLTPISRKALLIDIAKELSLPVLLVSRNKLGTINHSLLTIEALKNRNMEILGIVFNNPKREKGEILKDNPKIIKGLTKIKVFGRLPWMNDKEALYRAFIPIGKRIRGCVFS
ncbi:MAG: dethiobiotin synthase [bacterium]